MRRLALLLALLALPAPAAARRSRLHRHEIVGDIVLAAAPGANAVFLEGTYRLSATPIASDDPELPALRRFRLHPDSLFVHFLRDGDVMLGTTELTVGGELGRGLVYVRGEVGLGLVAPGYLGDGTEDGFLELPVELAAGVRGRSAQLGVVAAAHPVLDAFEDSSIYEPSYRSGGSTDLGGELAGAVGDRFLASLRLTYHSAAYRFTGFDPGDLLADGVRGRLDLVFPVSEGGSFVVRVDAARLDWDNRRLGETDRIDGDLHLAAIDVVGTVGYTFWFEGELGFSAALGGGYLGARPLYNWDARPLGAIRLGLVKRF